MQLNDQVCELELAKKLLAFGVNQQSLFFWYKGLKEPFADYHGQGRQI